MAAIGFIVAIRNNNRIFRAGIMLVAACLVVRWTSELLGISIRPKQSWSREANQSRVSQFVSLCSSNFDNRRLGNQLFNWAAMMYVARLTGILYTVFSLLGYIGGGWPYGNIVGSINEVTLRRAGLVLRWVTVCGYSVSVFGQATQANSAWPSPRQ